MSAPLPDAPTVAPHGDDTMIKAVPSHNEDIAKKLDDDVVTKPDSIANMTEVEIKALEKKMVRKMDAIIMYVLGNFGAFVYASRLI